MSGDVILVLNWRQLMPSSKRELYALGHGLVTACSNCSKIQQAVY